MLIVKDGIYPKDTGWTFPDSRGGIIHGEGLDDLAANVASFRAKNQLPEGEPLREVIEYLCASNGGLCKAKHQPVVVQAAPSASAAEGRKFDDRILDWSASWLEAFRGQIAPEEIRRRAAACRVCPLNRAYNPTCGPCKRRLQRAMDAVIGGFPRDAMKGLGACGHYVWENRLACGSDICGDGDAPAGCWRRPR